MISVITVKIWKICADIFAICAESYAHIITFDECSRKFIIFAIMEKPIFILTLLDLQAMHDLKDECC
jgi:hypothetical protein